MIQIDIDADLSMVDDEDRNFARLLLTMPESMSGLSLSPVAPGSGLGFRLTRSRTPSSSSTRSAHARRLPTASSLCLRLRSKREEMAEMSKLPPIHPGEVLMADFIEPLGITQHKVAVAIDVPPRRINEIVHGRRRITADTALRLARYFGTSDLFWINLQNRYDLEVERDSLGSKLDDIRPLQTA